MNRYRDPDMPYELNYDSQYANVAIPCYEEGNFIKYNLETQAGISISLSRAIKLAKKGIVPVVQREGRTFVIDSKRNKIHPFNEGNRFFGTQYGPDLHGVIGIRGLQILGQNGEKSPLLKEAQQTILYESRHSRKSDNFSNQMSPPEGFRLNKSAMNHRSLI